MKLHFLPKSLLAAISLLACFSFAGPPAEAQYLAKTLHSFTGANGDGANPQAGLIMDASGNLYGTTPNGGGVVGRGGFGGSVFELVNSSGSYSENILYDFASVNAGISPYAGLIMDGSGNLYGTTYFAGPAGYGTVFELVNSSGTYSEKVLYSFTNANGDGALPSASLVMDGSGNLYGTTQYGGVANGECGFEDGISQSCGTVFELVNSGGTYSEKVLYAFTGGFNGDGANPTSGLIIDGSGNLYGTTTTGGTGSGCPNGDFSSTGCGTVFELVNSSGSYSEKILYSFSGENGDGNGPEASVIMDGSGNLYGITDIGGTGSACTSGCGTVFELVNSSGSYSEEILYNFAGGNDGANPEAPVIVDASGNLYGTTFRGGTNGLGTVFELVNSSGNYSENVLYAFSGAGSDGANPQAPLVMDGSGNLYGTTYFGGADADGVVFEVVKTVARTTTTLTSSANPAVAGESITLTATVTAPEGSPIGTVTFFFRNGSVTQELSLSGSSGTAQLPVLDAEVLGGIGTYNVTAKYIPSNPAFEASSATLKLTVTEAGLVVTNGNNTLKGTETVNGNVDATAFVGNGAGLTNVIAAGLNCTSCVGNMQLGITYAGSSSQGGPATNALMFGGLLPSAFQPAGSYATTGANSFTGNQSVTGNLNVNGDSATTGTTTLGANGTPIVRHLSSTFNPSFPPVSAACTSQNFNFAGVRTGDTVALGVPNERMTAADVIYTAWVSAANKVTIRACGFSITPSNLGSGAIRVDVWQH